MYNFHSNKSLYFFKDFTYFARLTQDSFTLPYPSTKQKTRHVSYLILSDISLAEHCTNRYHPCDLCHIFENTKIKNPKNKVKK